MAKKKYLKSTRPLSIGELSSASARVKKLWTLDPRFDDEINVIGRLNYINLQLPSSIIRLDLRRLAIEGEINLEESPFPIFKKVFTSVRDSACGFDLIANIGFNEAASCQNKIYHDSIGIHVDNGVCYFYYRANGAVLSDIAYRLKFMRRLQSESGLPLHLVEQHDYYELKHSEGGRLRILDSEGFGRNPTAFSCEIVDGTATMLVSFMKRFLKNFGSSKRFWQHWEIFTRDQGGNASSNDIDAKKLYNYLSTKRELFRASRYQVRFDCTLQDERPLEVLQSLWKPNDYIYAALAAFETLEIGRLTLHAFTQDVGHWLWAEVQGRLSSQELEAHLGIEFEDIQEGWEFWDKE